MQIALETGADTARFRTLLTVFWGMVFAKCFVLEYAVQLYAVPINSVIYVWTLSLTMATVVTFIHIRARNFNPLSLQATTPRLIKRVWIAVFISALIFAVASKTFGIFPSLLLPGLFSVMLGIGFFIQSSMIHKRIFAIAAIGWWAVAIPLLAGPYRVNLFWFGIAILALQVVPASTIWLKAKLESSSPTPRQEE
ncbi:MAG: hypothetical protein MK080_08665 [Opitutales bacterium]|nr:hypothetical protein [Opitutales bacterium]NRA27526.1 hypothetical protein [Opitutales bacterium]